MCMASQLPNDDSPGLQIEEQDDIREHATQTEIDRFRYGELWKEISAL